MWRGEKSCPYRNSNSDPFAIQPVVSRCTDCYPHPTNIIINIIKCGFHCSNHFMCVHGCVCLFVCLFVQGKTKFVTFSFQEACHRQMVQVVKWSNNGCLIVTISVLSSLPPFRGKQQCTTWHSLECLNMLSSTVVTVALCLATSSSLVLGGSIYSSHVPTKKIHQSLIWWQNAMQLASDIHSTMCCLNHFWTSSP
jgi:hypothetical protein